MYHLHTQNIGKSSGRSAVAASAYRAACKLIENVVDKETGVSIEMVHDYTKKQGVVFSKILTPENAPSWAVDREMLWNKIQHEFEVGRHDARLAREFDIALPCELTEEENTALLQEFVHEAFVKEGMIADVNFHNDNPENPHAHVMLSLREIISDGNGDYTFGNKVRHWNKSEFLVHVRRLWAGYLNKHYELAGVDKEVSHLSFKERGIDLTPTIKEGIGRFVKGADRQLVNKEIIAENLASIKENPELVIDRLRNNKPVFTKEEIAKELFTLYSIDEHDYKEIAAVLDTRAEETNVNSDSTNIDSDKANKLQDIISESAAAFNSQKSLSDYIVALGKVMNGDKILSLNVPNIEGKQLYTSRARYELEKDFVDIARDLKSKESLHNLGITEADLDKKNLIEKASEVVDIVKEKLGFDHDKIVLSQEQKKVVLEVLNGGNVSVVEGLPGSGKTWTTREIVRQYKKGGYRVFGAAVSSSAARELAESAGIRAVNITKLRKDLDAHAGRRWNLNLTVDYYKDESENTNETGFLKELEESRRNIQIPKLTSKDVLVIDEWSMIDLPEIHYLLSEAKKSGVKLVAIGDRNQLVSVGIQGAGEKQAEIFDVSRLEEVRRQKNPEHCKATRLLSEFRVSEAVEIYRKTNVFRFSENLDKAKDGIVKDYVSEYVSRLGIDHNKKQSTGSKGSKINNRLLSSKMVVLAYTNKDVASLNDAIRSKLVDQGAIRGKELVFQTNRGGLNGTIALAKGDQVVFTRNNHFLGVANSDVGEVIGFSRNRTNDRDTLLIRVHEVGSRSKSGGADNGRIIEVDNHHYKGLDYGYAVNVYKAQGKTYDMVFGLIDSHTGYNMFNVMATRHRDNLLMYTSNELLEDELYRKVSLDASDGRTKYELLADDKDLASTKYAGLVSMIQRRIDTSLAIDYQELSKTEESELVNKYVEVRTEVMEVRQKINKWMELERAKGVSRSYKESPYYDNLARLLVDRKHYAVAITDEYDLYKKILHQSNMNYMTILKHAERERYKYSFSRDNEFKSVKDIENFGLILDLQEKLSKYKIKPIFAQEIVNSANKLENLSYDLLEKWEESRAEISKVRNELQEIKKEEHAIKSYIEDGKEYIEKHLPKYLDNTFKEQVQDGSINAILAKEKNTKNNNNRANNREQSLEESKSSPSSNPHYVLKTFGELKEKHGLDRALSIVKKNPQMFGELKGIGIGNFISLNKSRMQAIENTESLASKLEKYEEYKEKIFEYEKILNVGTIENKILEKEIELRSLESNLPSKSVEDFVEGAYEASKHIVKDKYIKVLEWAKDIDVATEAKVYRGFFNDSSKENSLETSNNKEKKFKGKGKGETISQGQQSQNKKFKDINRDDWNYIKSREEFLNKYESSRATDDKSRIYRSIAGSNEPNLALDILEDTVFKNVSGDKAYFVLVNDHFPDSRLDDMKRAMLQSVQHVVSYDVKEVELLTEEQSKILSIRSELSRISESLLKLNREDPKFDSVLDKAEEYTIEHIVLYGKAPTSQEQEKMIQRAAFEAANREGWIRNLSSTYIDSLGSSERFVLSSGEQLLIEKQAERLTSIESRLYMEASEQLNGKYRNTQGNIDTGKIITETQKLEASREDRIVIMMGLNKVVRELGQKDKIAARNMAEQIVDFGFRYGEDKINSITDTSLNMMKEIGIQQSEIAKEVATGFDKGDFKPNKSDKKVYTQDIIEKDRAGVVELAKDDISKVMTKEMVISKIESIDVSKAQILRNEQSKSAFKTLESMQKTYKQERVLEIKNDREIELSRGRGMGFDR